MSGLPEWWIAFLIVIISLTLFFLLRHLLGETRPAKDETTEEARISFLAEEDIRKYEADAPRLSDALIASKTRAEAQKIADEVMAHKETQVEAQEVIREARPGPHNPLRVFICLMPEELATEQIAIAKHVQPLKELELARPLQFEDFPISPDLPEEVYRQAAKRGDIFVIVVARQVFSPVMRECQLAIEEKKPCYGFAKSVGERSEQARRFLVDIAAAATWSEFETPKELADKVVEVLVADLIGNYRRYRLTQADVLALTTLGEHLQLDHEILEQAREQAEREHELDWHPWEPDMIYIPAGQFHIGSTEAEVKSLKEQYSHSRFDSEIPQHRLSLKGYWIGKYLITSAQYKYFMEATEHEPPDHWTDGIIPAGKDDHPVVGVNWHDAVAYCKWLAHRTRRHYRLPTEAEWEKAARGTDGRLYPWGNKWDPGKCNASESGIGDTTPVGKYSPQGDSLYGCTDMAGNVWEWTGSLYKPYPYRPEDGREDEPVPGSRVLRGGSFADDKSLVRSACRDSYHPGGRIGYRGFRVSLVVPFIPSL